MQKEQDVCPPNRSHIHLSQSSTKLSELNSNHSRFHFDSETELLESQKHSVQTGLTLYSKVKLFWGDEIHVRRPSYTVQAQTNSSHICFLLIVFSSFSVSLLLYIHTLFCEWTWFYQLTELTVSLLPDAKWPLKLFNWKFLLMCLFIFLLNNHTGPYVHLPGYILLLSWHF